MPTTTRAAEIKTDLVKVGATPYDVSAGRPETSKVARYRLPNGQPLVVETDRKAPNLWMLPDHERGLLGNLGNAELRPAFGRHYHLEQVREFRGRELVRVRVTAPDRAQVARALKLIAQHPNVFRVAVAPRQP